ncbi:hypothetical protein FNV43_RR06224 [Rhamnella rubrinervis]|uniref:Receptor-like serine/threonine-protein kinase n=1 Tax=Rhamnella rubrinervis TaxID=2594499 RepID=A0A8K0HDF4_9ROSA|nr:hypothetical protein FNV43_RR06224 [Rhamnella rubrinervis]
MAVLCLPSFLFSITNLLLLLFTSSATSALDSIGPFQSISDGQTLVSKQGSFRLGFFSPGISKNRYLGIWYNNIPTRTVVWVANRCNPINDSSGLLTINSRGNLVLFGHNNNESEVWSTRSVKQAKNPLVQILDNGNLALRDEEDGGNPEAYLWQSFDYPCDTLLPEMKLGWDLRTGLKRSLSAWKNPDDPCPGDFTYGYELGQTYPEAYIRNHGAKFYRNGPWNGLRFSGVPELTVNRFFNFGFVYNEDDVYYTYKLINESVLSRIVLNQTTSTRERSVWVEAEQAWKQYSSLPRDYCDHYGLCGANGKCVISQNPVCECLDGFKPKSDEDWNNMEWSEGCERSVPLSCQERYKDGFVKFVGLKLPDTTHSWVNKTMNLKECRAKCLRNCSCMAYTNSDIRGEGSGCVLWFGDLVDIRGFPENGQDLYIRMPASELEKKRKAIVDSKVKTEAIIVAVIGVAFAMLFVGFAIARNRTVDLKASSDRIKIDDSRGRKEDLELPMFKQSTIAIATNNFSLENKIGEGGYGPVYRGLLQDGQEIAVKRLSPSSGQGVNEFKNEVILISKLNHRNLVRLLGCCIKGEDKMLVYEYMPNKSLDTFIFDEKQSKLLDWSQRFKIIHGIARGLVYLHQDSRLRIIHRDLKASNVLLDRDMNPKISDFGLARISGGDQIEGNTNRVVGTYGYMAPEYALDGKFSTKSDVFSFGTLMLEIISGMKSRGFHHPHLGVTLIGHAWRLMQEGRALELIDGDKSNYSKNVTQEVLRCVHVSLLCVQQQPGDRPSMSSVLLMLSSTDSDLPEPKPPGYFMETYCLAETDSFSSKHVSFSNNDITISIMDAR